MEDAKIPDSLLMKVGDMGLLAAAIGPGEHMDIWAQTTGKTEIFGVKCQEFDFFHEAIVHEELGRMGAGGMGTGLAWVGEEA